LLRIILSNASDDLAIARAIIFKVHGSGKVNWMNDKDWEDER